MRETNTQRPLVLFSISNGWGVRNIVHTGLLKTVAQFADVGVAASADLAPYFEGLRQRGIIVAVFPLPESEKPLWRYVRQSKKAILQARHDISTARIKWLRGAGGIAHRKLRALIWLAFHLLACRWQVRLLEIFENRFAHRVAPPQRLPCVLVNCSPFDFRDNCLMRSLCKSGVPAISIIPSWDNPSTKGAISTSAALVLVWGDSQKRELRQYYPWVDAHKIRVCGIPQFDEYRRESPAKYSRAKFFSDLGIPESAQVILYATCSESLFPTEPEVVEDISNALVAGRIPRNTYLLVRCHPADRSDRYARLEKNPNVRIFGSSRDAARSLYNWIPPVDEIDVLTAMLFHSSMCINTASTMTLDAFACEKPVINVAYDGRFSKPYFNSVRRYYDYHHYAPIIRSGAVPLARSAQELEELICAELKDPGARHSLREEIINEFCLAPRMGSVEYIKQRILDIVG